MGFNDLSLYNGGAGDGSLMTPNIDSLAKELSLITVTQQMPFVLHQELRL